MIWSSASSPGGFAPKGTPQEAIDGFASALQASTSTDRYQKFLESKGFANLFLGGNDLQQDLQNTWTAIQPVSQASCKKISKTHHS